MAEFAANADARGPIDTTLAWVRHFRVTAVLTAAGAVATASGQAGATDPAITIAKDGGTTGEYDVTFPKSPGYVSIHPTIISPLGTIGQMYVRAKNDAAGTASLIFSAPDGTAAYGADGDIIILDFFIETRPKT